jgi:competence protein ComEA
VVAEPTEQPPASATDLKPGVTKDGKVDLNHATVAELQTLPGIDAAAAEAIVAARPLAGFHELLRIPGVTPATLREIFPRIVE